MGSGYFLGVDVGFPPASGLVSLMPVANGWLLRHTPSRSFDPVLSGLSSHLQKSGSRFAMQ